MIWVLLHRGMTQEHLGLLPDMLDEADPRPAKEQFNDNYQHGGGWHHFAGFTMHKDFTLTYPKDPPLPPIASTQLRDELIILYQHDWVAIIQRDGSFEICRMD
jgi:hypothetical protein